jgi:hypothetical protein
MMLRGRPRFRCFPGLGVLSLMQPQVELLVKWKPLLVELMVKWKRSQVERLGR